MVLKICTLIIKTILATIEYHIFKSDMNTNYNKLQKTLLLTLISQTLIGRIRLQILFIINQRIYWSIGGITNFIYYYLGDNILICSIGYHWLVLNWI